MAEVNLTKKKKRQLGVGEFVFFLRTLPLRSLAEYSETSLQSMKVYLFQCLPSVYVS